jgi:hypothetical protein
MNYKTISRITIVLMLFVFSVTNLSAQVVQKIGTNSFTINPKAVLELESTTKGFLPPRMTADQQTTMGTTLPKGLVVYIIDGSATGLQIWNGTSWSTFVDVNAIALKAPIASPTFTGTVSGITATMVGLGNVDNTTDLLKPISTATQTALDTKSSNSDLALKAPIASPTFTGTVSGITATMVGLANVDNTTDLLKPISTATLTALNTKEDKTNKSLDVNTDQTSDIKYPTVKAVKTYVDVYSTFNAISTITSNYTATRTDYTILCNNNSGAFQLTLPVASANSGKIYVIRKTDESSNVLTISPSLKLTESTVVSSLDYPKTMRVQSNGSDWYIID